MRYTQLFYVWVGWIVQDWSLALAAAAIAFRSSAVKRTGTMRPLATPLGILGRPTFLAFFCCAKVPKLLSDRCPHCHYGRRDGVNV